MVTEPGGWASGGMAVREFMAAPIPTEVEAAAGKRLLMTLRLLVRRRIGAESAFSGMDDWVTVRDRSARTVTFPGPGLSTTRRDCVGAVTFNSVCSEKRLKWRV